MTAISSPIEAAAGCYAAFLEALSPERLGDLQRLCAPEVRFRNPCSDTRGIPAMIEALRDMLVRLDAPHFTVTGSAVEGSRALLAWTMAFRPKGRPDEMRIEGTSFVTFDAAGRVVEHIDLWDSAGERHMRLPMAGTVARLLQRRLSTDRDDDHYGRGTAESGRVRRPPTSQA